MKRGEIWFVNLDPVIGNEQAGKRPVLVISVDAFNLGGSRMVVAVPFTKRDKKQPLHVLVKAQETGLTVDSFIKTEDIRGISKERLISKIGEVNESTISEVEIRLKRLLGLE
ncbi:mRNA interferase MazF [Anaerobacterium chartisolvens]|uniref:mRNA interferase n=1 Tax=Anaerobacterium chartisolvens TaxID=1297424 RepID=A0A369BDX8_9FIRM|nr:type II toxin-antitoxin system PemK/MazF family toxin [Anaerobacterium chartisolvens]RCX17874.1 mRNA interferase MazF [Anaerobacterium chartisolvens]